MNTSLQLAPVTPWNVGAPRINGPELTGASAGKPFLYTVPVTGQRPVEFSSEGLPQGLTLDRNTGRITGCVAAEGKYEVLFKVKNSHGTDEKKFDMVIGEGLALTPPMGWNSWNACRHWVDDNKIRSAADALVSSGLAARGYSYVNVDSCWQGVRGGKFNAIQPNSKFPDMPGLISHVHDLGLKFGIYSSPWVCPWGCTGKQAAEWGGGELIGSSAGERDVNYASEYPYDYGKYVGVEKYEPNDVAQWVEWGVDFLKYDWAPTDPVCLERMGRLIKDASRDIVMSVCTHARIEHADAFLKWANMWRGGRDIVDEWKILLLTSFYIEENPFMENWRPFMGPGHWYDLDMTALGPQFADRNTTRPCGFTPDEQITHMSYWALYPSPLFLSCNLADMDDFTLRLFANEEIIAVNQDRLGQPAIRVKETRRQALSSEMLHDNRVHARRLGDGSIAAGFFNLLARPDRVSISLSEFGISGPVKIRNLWERRDIGTLENEISLCVPAHGAQMIRITR